MVRLPIDNDWLRSVPFKERPDPMYFVSHVFRMYFVTTPLSLVVTSSLLDQE